MNEKALTLSEHLWRIAKNGMEDSDDMLLSEMCRLIDDGGEQASYLMDLESQAASLRSHVEELEEALVEVMGWIENWGPEFAEDPEWEEDTLPRVQALLDKRRAQILTELAKSDQQHL